MHGTAEAVEGSRVPRHRTDERQRTGTGVAAGRSGGRAVHRSHAPTLQAQEVCPHLGSAYVEQVVQQGRGGEQTAALVHHDRPQHPAAQTAGAKQAWRRVSNPRRFTPDSVTTQA